MKEVPIRTVWLVILWDPVCANIELVSWAVEFKGSFSKLSVCSGGRREM